MSDATLPVDGSCNCGGVRFRVSGPFIAAGYCHCTHCQKRTGTGSALTGRIAREDLKILAGDGQLRAWTPPNGGNLKWFCVDCGGHLFAGDLEAGETVGVRLGAFDGPVDVTPSYHIFVRSAPSWEPVPDDGLVRHETLPPS